MRYIKQLQKTIEKSKSIVVIPGLKNIAMCHHEINVYSLADKNYQINS